MDRAGFLQDNSLKFCAAAERGVQKNSRWLNSDSWGLNRPTSPITPGSRGRQRKEVVVDGGVCVGVWRGASISAKQMAHRDTPVVFHHINFTLALPLFQRRDGEKKTVCVCGWVVGGWGRWRWLHGGLAGKEIAGGCGVGGWVGRVASKEGRSWQS